MSDAPAMHLVVHSPFPGYVKGDVITDPAVVASILAGEFEIRVVKTLADRWQKPQEA